MTLGGSYALYSSNWAGNQDLYDHYDQAQMNWTVPSVCYGSPQVCYFDHHQDMSTWPGIGGGTSPSDQIVQLGTEGKISQTGLFYSAWWESYPYNSSQTMTNFSISPGDPMYGWVGYGQRANAESFYLVDQRTGTYANFYFGPIGCVCNTAEFITERDLSSALATWSPNPYSNSSANVHGTTGGWQSAGQPSHYSYHMTKTGAANSDPLANPTAWTDPGTNSSFPVVRTSFDQ